LEWHRLQTVMSSGSLMTVEYHSVKL
jgi:hypothetical protein